MDGVLNVQDVILIINYILGEINFDAVEQSLADLNNDELINIQDIVLLINVILD